MRDLFSEFILDASKEMQPMAIAGKREIHWIAKIVEEEQNRDTPAPWPPSEIAQRYNFAPQSQSCQP